MHPKTKKRPTPKIYIFAQNNGFHLKLHLKEVSVDPKKILHPKYVHDTVNKFYLGCTDFSPLIFI